MVTNVNMESYRHLQIHWHCLSSLAHAVIVPVSSLLCPGETLDNRPNTGSYNSPTRLKTDNQSIKLYPKQKSISNSGNNVGITNQNDCVNIPIIGWLRCFKWCSLWVRQVWGAWEGCVQLTRRLRTMKTPLPCDLALICKLQKCRFCGETLNLVCCELFREVSFLEVF